MRIKITKRDIYWSYASYILQTGAGFFLLPIILNRLPSDELAIWYVFLSITALINLLDFGLQPTIMRNVSYIFSGARKLSKQGVIIHKEEVPVDYSLLKRLIKTVKSMYMIISFVIAILMFSLGSFYIKNITINLANQSEILKAWYVYVVSIVLNFYFYYYTPLLTGRGKIAESNQTIVMSKLSFLIVASIGLISGYGLMAVSIGNLFSSFVNRLSSFYFFYDKEIKYKLSSVEISKINLLPILRINAYKLGLVSIGAFLITKGNTLIASNFLELNIVAQYGLTLQLINLLSAISSIYFRTFLPKYSNYRMLGDLEGIRKDYSKSMLVMNVVYILGGILILILGDWVVSLIGSNTSLLTKSYVFILLIVIYLETNHSNCATLITTKNEVPFVKSAIFSGVGVLVLSLISTKYLSFGMIGLILSQGFVQLLYNNWKWPKEVYKDLNTNYFEMILVGIDEWKMFLQGLFVKTNH